MTDERPSASNGLRLDSRVGIVTGAASGLGKAIATMLAERGASVVLVDVNQAGLEAVAGSIVAGGGSVATVVGSVTEASTARAAVATCLERWQRIDFLVNNAAIAGRHAPIWEFSESEWDQVMDVSVKGAFHMVQAAVPAMIERRWGRIVNMSSIAAKDAIPGTAHYTTAKIGLIGLTRVLAREVAPYGILANVVTPGPFDTPIRHRPEADAEAVEGFVQRIPLGRIGEPDEMARMVGFLVSDEMTFTTGYVFDMSGGWAVY